MPNLPASQDFTQKVKAKAYRVTERAGLIWVYMGARVSCRRYRLGTMCSAYRPAGDGKTYWRFVHFGFPFRTRVPQGVDAPEVYARTRSGECVMQGDDWQAVYDERLKHAVSPVALRDAAE